MPTEDGLYEGKKGFSRNFKLPSLFPSFFAEIWWELIPCMLPLWIQCSGWPAGSITLSLHTHCSFPVISRLAPSAFCVGWSNKGSWATVGRFELLLGAWLTLGVKRVSAKISHYEAKWMNKLESKRKHWESHNFLISTGWSSGAALQCRGMDEQLGMGPLMAMALLLLNPSKRHEEECTPRAVWDPLSMRCPILGSLVGQSGVESEQSEQTLALCGCTLKHPEKRSILQLGSCERSHSRAPGSKYIFSIFCQIGFFVVIVFVVVCCQELNSKSKKYMCWVSVDFCPSFPDGQFSSWSQKIPFEKKSKILVFSGGN